MPTNNQHSDLVLLRLCEVLRIFPVSKSSWWLGVREGRYPKPIRLGPRTVAWLESSIRELIQNLQKEAV